MLSWGILFNKLFCLTSHFICEPKKGRIGIHIYILIRHIRSCTHLNWSMPAPCLQYACSLHSVLKEFLQLVISIAFLRLRNSKLISILTYLRCIYKEFMLHMQCSCSMPADCTLRVLLKSSKKCHWGCEVKKFWIDIHVDIFKICSLMMCIALQHACMVVWSSFLCCRGP